MNKYQKKINQLLNEVIDICDANSIPWFLSGRNAIRCYTGNLYKNGFLDMELTIPISCALKFIDACKDLDKRYVEGYMNNPDFLGLFLKYIDTETTMICMNEGLSSYVRGMFVKVKFLRNESEDVSLMKKADKYEALIEDTSKAYIDLTGKTSSIERFWFRIKKYLVPRYNERIFHYLINAYSGEQNQRVSLRMVDGRTIIFAKDRFARCDLYKSEDTVVWIPRDAVEYFEKCYGAEWEEFANKMVIEGRLGDAIKEGANNLTSLTVPYTMFTNELSKTGINKKFFIRRQRKGETAAKESQMGEEVRKYWYLAKRAGDLWNIYDYYEPKKKIIKDLFDIGEFFALQKEFEFYDEVVTRNRDLGLAFMYDKDLWEIYLYVKQCIDGPETVEVLKELLIGDEELKVQLRDMERQKQKLSV